MLINFFFVLRKHKVKTSITEYLDLMAALKSKVVEADMDGFYYLSRIVLIKDESQYDKFDRAFAEYFKGVQQINLFDEDIPQDWLRSQAATNGLVRAALHPLVRMAITQRACALAKRKIVIFQR